MDELELQDARELDYDHEVYELGLVCLGEEEDDENYCDFS
jgi:hypothetical protein